MTATVTDLQISVASTQYVRAAIFEASGADPTGDTVTMAFPITGVDPTVFVAASWVTLSGIHYARCLVGPAGSITLPIGYYDVYVKVTDSPEVPVLLSGTLEVF
jgi:hypothetical protein